MEKNNFGVPDIANSDLRQDNVPSGKADWITIFQFALSYDGYSHHNEQCGEIANAAFSGYSALGIVPDSLDELRTCLFFEQRRWRHFGETPNEEARRYFEALLDAIRAKTRPAP